MGKMIKFAAIIIVCLLIGLLVIACSTDPTDDYSYLLEQLKDIKTNAVEGGSYTITLSKNETLTARTGNSSPNHLEYGGKNVTIKIKGDIKMRTISIGTESEGNLFRVQPGVTLILDNNLTLQGKPGNTISLVGVYGGTLEMNNNVVIKGNENTTGSGGGVRIDEGGNFIMTGGTISNNSTTGAGLGNGGGVVVMKNSSFEMSGGNISNNSAAGSGGGVCIEKDSILSLNTPATQSSISSNSASYGGNNALIWADGFYEIDGTLHSVPYSW